MIKKIIALLCSLVLILFAASASAAGIRVGELTYLNSDDATRSQMMTAFESALNQFVGSLFAGKGIDRVEVVSFDNLNAMEMALQSGQIDAMILYVTVGNYLARETQSLSVFNRISEYADPGKYQVHAFDEIPEEFPAAFWFALDQMLGTDFSFMMMDDHAALRDEFNQAIAEMNADGTFLRLMQEQFDALAEGKALEAVPMEKIEGAETIRVAVTGDLPPMDYMDESGNPAGFNTAVLSEIGKKIGKNIEMVSIESGARAVALASGTVDVVFWCRVASPYDGLAEAVADTVDPGLIAALIADASSKRNPMLDIPENTILTDPYWHDLVMPLYQIQ